MRISPRWITSDIRFGLVFGCDIAPPPHATGAGSRGADAFDEASDIGFESARAGAPGSD
jgi:hypothetical protein